ncbi:unnamed protein product [Caenorhabditis brenneri]
MKFFIILSALLLSNGTGEIIEEIRRSCTEKTVYLKTGHSWRTNPMILNKKEILENGSKKLSEKDWLDAVRYECEEKRSTNGRKTKEKISILPNTTKPSDPVMERIEELWQEEEFRRRAVGSYWTIDEEIIPVEIVELLPNTTKPILYMGCSDNALNVRFEMRDLKKEDVWKCEDIGEADNNVYEYYDIPSYWMFTESTNQTKRIQETSCNENVSICTMEAVESIDCHINNTESCTKVLFNRYYDNSNSSSYIRQLPGGVSVYGTFVTQVHYPEGTLNETATASGWGLYYFSYYS